MPKSYKSFGLVVLLLLHFYLFIYVETNTHRQGGMCVFFLKFKEREEDKKVVTSHYISEYDMYNIT